MKRLRFAGPDPDRRGMLLAVLCFVHCVAGPVLLTYAGFTSLMGVSENLEPLFVVGSAAMGAIALVPAYRKKHGRKSCLALFASGLLFLLLRRRIEISSVPIEPIVTGVGAALLVASHLLNLRFSRHCRCCSPQSETKTQTESSVVAAPERER